ncbi:MAG: hypothetical protein ACE5KM_12640, partial [Planctomycetaceae bacterium]
MSRRRSGELEFGSDSFLDIIANIVGILIILIVVAGLRVARAPVSVRDASEPPSKAATGPPLPVVDGPPSPRPAVLPPLPQPVRAVDSSAATRLISMRRDLASAKAKNSRLLAQLRNVQSEQQAVEVAHAQVMRKLQSTALSSDKAAERVKRLQNSAQR